MITVQPTPFFFGAPDRSLFGCFYPPAPGSNRDHGVVLCHPMGAEYLRAHRACLQLATRLARQGLPTLRFDYYGTGDSGGASEEGALSQWRDDIATAISELKERSGVRQVSLVGLRLGGALAMLTGTVRSDLAAIVLWDPVVRGDVYLTELKQQHQEMVWRFFVAPKAAAPGSQPTELLGFPMTERLLADLDHLDLLAVQQVSSAPLLLVECQATAEARRLRAHLEQHGRSVSYQHIPGFKAWVEDVDKGLVPLQSINAITSWLSEVCR